MGDGRWRWMVGRVISELREGVCDNQGVGIDKEVL